MTQAGRRDLRWRVLLGALLVLGATLALLRTRTAAESACTLARRELPSLLGMDVGIGSCVVDPLGQTVRLRGVSLFEPGALTPLLAADEAEVSLGAVRPFFGSLELDHVRIVRPRVNLDFSSNASAPDRQGHCSLEPLRRLDIGRLDIRNAEVRIALPDGRAVEVLGGDVTWRRRRGRAEIRLHAKTGRFVPNAGAEMEISTLRVDARLDAESERLEFTRAELDLDGVSLSGSGAIERLCEPELSLEASVFVPMSSVALATGLEEPVSGHLWGLVQVQGSAVRPTVTMQVAGTDITVGPYTPGSFDAELALQSDTLRIARLETSVGDGILRATGTVGLTGKLPVDLDVQADRGELGPALARAGLPGAWVNFPASGKGRFAGNLHPFRVEGHASLNTGRFVLATHAFDAPVAGGQTLLEFERADISGTIIAHPDRVEFVRVRAGTPRTSLRADATLHFAAEKGLHVAGVADTIDFDDFGHFAGIRWAGRGGGTFLVHGPYSDVRASAQVSLQDFEFWKLSLGVLQGRIEYAGDVVSFPSAHGQKGRTPYAGSGALDFGRGGLHTRGEVVAERGRLSDLVDLLLPLHENIALFQGPLDGELKAKMTIDSPADAFASVLTLDVADTRYYGRRLGDGRIVLRFVEGERAILEKTVLRGPLGRAEVEGTWDFEGPLDYRFRVDGKLAEVVGPERSEELGVAGDLTLVGKVGGDTTVYTVNAWLTSPSVRFADRNLGSTHLEGRIVGRDLQVWGRAFEGGRTNLKMKLKEPFAWEASGQLALPEIGPLLPKGAVAQGVSGSISAAFNATGNLRDSRAVAGTAIVDRFTLTRGDFHGRNDGRIELTWRGGKLTVENLLFRGPNTQLSMAGTAGPRLLDLDVHGSFDLRLLESFVPQLERSSGRVELTGAARGTLEAPTLAGTASVSDARLSVRDQPVSFRGVSGRVEFSEARVLVHEFRGVLNEGRVALDGDIRLERFAPKSLELRVQLDEVSARPLEYLPFTTTGELNLAGRPDALVLSGDLDIVKLRYDQPLVLESFLTDLRTARVGQGSGEGPRKAWLAFDVAIHASGDVRVDNNLARARLGGDLRLTGTNLAPGLLGTIEAKEGSQIFFRGNTFQVDQALVEFKDRREIDPVFDLHAQTQVREFLVTLHSFGRLRDPQIILSADPDLPEADILSLLTLGVTSRDQNMAEGTAQVVLSEALFNASGLDKQVQRFLPRNPLLRDLSFHIASAYNESSGRVEPTAQLESRLLSERLLLQLSQSVVPDSNGNGGATRAQAEYRFDDRLAGQLQWDTESVQSQGVPNVGMDLKLRWEVE